MKDFFKPLSFLTILPFGRTSRRGEGARTLDGFFPVGGPGDRVDLGPWLLFPLISFRQTPRPLANHWTFGTLNKRPPFGWICRYHGWFGLWRNKEKILEVMRDSRIGAFGVISLILLIGAKYFAWIKFRPPLSLTHSS